MSTISGAGGINANLAPDAFHRWAQHYYKCKQDFASPQRFSPVPYFLLCRAIELELKARHLNMMTQEEVKSAFGHDLMRAYDALPPPQKQLDSAEVLLLRHASVIYCGKGVEYFDAENALTAYKRYPDLAALDRVARSLVEP